LIRHSPHYSKHDSKHVANQKTSCLLYYIAYFSYLPVPSYGKSKAEGLLWLTISDLTSETILHYKVTIPKPFAPDIFKPLGITLLTGILVTDPQGILRQVSEGGGMGSLKGYIEKVNLPITQ